MKKEIIIKTTHRGLKYEDGVLTKILEAGRYEIPPEEEGFWIFKTKKPKTEIVLVDMRERDLTIKGQEILTSDKVAIRVSIIVQFRVIDPQAAIHEVENYEDRLYSDVQLAARRSLASMTLEEILTNRNRLSEDISTDVKEAAGGYGVSILRADVKDLIFPGNLQEIMNRVLAAERMSEAQLVEARTKAEVQKISAKMQTEINRLEAKQRAETEREDSEIKAEIKRKEAEANAEVAKKQAELNLEIENLKKESEIKSLQNLAESAKSLEKNPALLRLRELETLKELAKTANARIYIGFDKHSAEKED
ncbi:MAG: slipin family protein [Blastocatellia bacterium]|nr:slipin family protein [Blastocatellia bacterium]